MNQDLTSIVSQKYGEVAASGLASGHAGVRAVAEAFGYSAEELAAIPADANMGLSCGNPTAFASLRPGEVVVDLGCGGGLDIFLAARKVGPTGRAIGIDMTPAMIDRARANAAKDSYVREHGNAEFHLATIDHLPLPDASVDCVISNCVINLASDKNAVFREIARVLKPGGRVAVSDIALKKSLPERVRDNVMAYVGCVAGAISIAEYRIGLAAAGFADVAILESGVSLKTYTLADTPAGTCGSGGGCCCGSDSTATCSGTASDWLRDFPVDDYAASIRGFAVKPKA